MRLTWFVFALGSAFFAGLTALFGKCGVAQFKSKLATLIRTIVILAMTAAVITWRSEWEPLNRLSRSNVVFLCHSRVATGLSWLCYYRAFPLGTASDVVPVDKLSLAFVILLAWWILGEPMTWREIASGTLVIAGGRDSGDQMKRQKVTEANTPRAANDRRLQDWVVLAIDSCLAAVFGIHRDALH